MLVKAGHGRERGTRIMPESKDFPLCGSAMQPKHSEQVVRIPGNPKETKRKVAEWIYPNCDYFEEAEEKST